MKNPKNRKVRVYQSPNPAKPSLRKPIIKQSEILNSIGALFQEFDCEDHKTKSVTFPMPNVPSLFSVFLYAEKAKDFRPKNRKNETVGSKQSIH